jgi:purine-binding chemotaxis protein CheW
MLPGVKEVVTMNSAGAAGRYLSFQLSTELYAVPIQTVSEIVGMGEITPVPNTPAFVKGVLNLRGSIIPIVDLRLKFHMNPTEYNGETCIIVMEVEDRKVGVIVDTVQEVVDFKTDDVEATPDLGDPNRLRFIRGLGKRDNKVSILIDVAQVVSKAEMADVTQRAA